MYVCTNLSTATRADVASFGPFDLELKFFHFLLRGDRETLLAFLKEAEKLEGGVTVFMGRSSTVNGLKKLFLLLCCLEVNATSH
jgi:hypothetical protein